MKISFSPFTRQEVVDLLRCHGLEVRNKQNQGRKPSVILTELLNEEVARRVEIVAFFGEIVEEAYSDGA